MGGFFYGGKLFYFDKTIDEVFLNTPGLSASSRKRVLNRLEIPNTLNSFKVSVTDLSKINNTTLTTPLNIIFSQINSVNNQVPDLKKLNTLRLFLTKSYRGRCHALGKPVKGQRT